jgi:hypothetical protein
MNSVFFAALLFLATSGYAQDLYMVQNIKGEVKKEGKALKKGDKLQSNEPLHFGKAALMLVSSQKVGQLVLSAKEKQAKRKYTIDDLLPKSPQKSTKINNILNSASDFQKHFGNSSFRVYGNNYSVRVAAAYNVMYTNENSDRFFFFQMRHPSEAAPFNKHLQGVKNHLYFRKNEIYTISGKAIDPQESTFLGLYFYDKKAGESFKLADFQIEFVEEQALLEATRPMAEMIDRKALDLESYELFCSQVREIAEQIYGKAEKDALEYWLENALRIYRPL